MERDQIIQQQLATINLEFADQLPERGQLIARLWDQFKQGGSDADGFSQLYRQIHNLAGSGGAFGYPRVTESGRKAISLLRLAAGREDHALSPEESKRQDGYVTELVAICEGRGHLPDLGQSGQEIIQVEEQTLLDQQPRLIFLVAVPDKARNRLAKRITSYGYQVLCFDSFAEAQQAQMQQLPMSVVLDIAAEELPGGGALEQLDMQSPFQVPVVLLADETDFSLRLASVRGGARGFFVKPVDEGNLLNFIERLSPQEVKQPFRVLIVDDDQKQADYHALILQRAGMDTRVLSNPAEIVQQLAGFDPELLLFDLYMPDCSGIELAKVVRQMDSCQNLPIVFLSIETELGHQQEAMKSGVDDFLTKPVQPRQLIASVGIRAWRARSLKSLMIRDSLTGLYNHGVIIERLQHMLALVERQQGSLCVAMLDLDDFKQINDRYGHDAGDRVLVAFSRLLRQRLRATDIVGRYGGEEFMLIFPDTPLQQAQCVLDELRVIFTGITFPSLEQKSEFTVTFSGGLAAYPDYPDSRSLLEAADAALHQAIEAGRDRIALAAANPAEGSA